MRLIDADKIIQWYSGTHTASAELLSNLLFLQEIVKYMPTVEAKPVVKAQWVDGVAYNAYSCKLCSNCGAIMPSDSSIDYIDEEDNKYCYNCGAKMEDVKNERN